MNFRGQISLESLLLWAALAGALALFTPVFAHAMEAQILFVHAHKFSIFSENVSATISDLSFSAPGAQQSVFVPSFEGFSADMDSNMLILKWENDSLTHPKLQMIESPVPLTGNTDISQKEWFFVRTREGITIR